MSFSLIINKKKDMYLIQFTLCFTGRNYPVFILFCALVGERIPDKINRVKR